MKKVITYGTFDLFHIGHLELLRRAKGLGDYLVVGVSNDKFNSLKGKIEPALYVKEHLPNIQKGFATNIAIHLIELLVKNKKDLLKGGLLLETYAPSNLLINF